MAGFETIVRPTIFPDIRPAPARSLPSKDDPDKGFAVIRGNAAKNITHAVSWSVSARSSVSREIQRRVDKARVYQQNEDGTINRNNFVDLEITNRLRMKGPPEPTTAGTTETAGEREPTVGPVTPSVQVEYYQPIQEAANIEVKQRNKIIDNPNE